MVGDASRHRAVTTRLGLVALAVAVVAVVVGYVLHVEVFALVRSTGWIGLAVGGVLAGYVIERTTRRR